MNDRFHEIMDLRFTGYVLPHGLLRKGYEALWGWTPRAYTYTGRACMISGETVTEAYRSIREEIKIRWIK